MHHRLTVRKGGSLSTVKVLGSQLEYRWIGPRPGERPTIVFLHEGLGCVGTWRDFPDRLASVTGCGALVYSRPGYGSSDPVQGTRPVAFMHDEALEVLPAVLERFRLEEVILFGHSDGASIAVIYAGASSGNYSRNLSGGPCGPPSPLAPVRGLVLEAPHVFVEAICTEKIARIAEEYETTRLRERLARYHGANTDSMFRTWTEVWLKPEFARWNIEESLPAIQSPVLVVQGEDDEYGTPAQVEAVLRQVKGPAESLVLPRCGHSPHTTHADEVLEAGSRFIREALRVGP